MEREIKTEITMTCTDCEVRCQRFGTHRNGLRRFRCPQCRKTYTEPHKQFLGGMQVNQDTAILALRMLVEGNSIRSTERITGIDRNTIMKLLVLAGEKCEKVMGRLIVNVPCKDVQADEIWGFVQKKEAHKFPFEKDDDSMGDAYCYVAMERHSNQYHLMAVVGHAGDFDLALDHQVKAGGGLILTVNTLALLVLQDAGTRQMGQGIFQHSLWCNHSRRTCHHTHSSQARY